MTAEKDIDHLTEDNPRQACGGRLQVQRILAPQNIAIIPLAPLQNKEEGSQRNGGFHHAQPQISPHQQRPVQQSFSARARRLLHEARLGCLGAQRQGRQHVGTQVDREDLDHRQRQWNPEKHKCQVGHQFRDIRGQDVSKELPKILEDRAPFLDGTDDTGEIVIQQNHVCGFLDHIGPRDSHGNPDVGGFQCGRIVHTIPCDRDDFSLSLQGLNDEHLLLGSHARKQNLRGVQSQLKLSLGHSWQAITPEHDRCLASNQPDLPGNGFRGDGMITCHHDDLDARRPTAGNRRRYFRPWRVFQSNQATERQSCLPCWLIGHQQAISESKHAQTRLGHLVLSCQTLSLSHSIQRQNGPIMLDRVANREDRLQCTFAIERARTIWVFAYHGHALAVAIKRNLGDALAIVPFKTTQLRLLHQGNFHGIAEQFRALLNNGMHVVADRRDTHQPTNAFRLQ